LQFLIKRIGGGDAGFDMLVTLCHAGADVNGLATRGGDTPLMMLARNGWARAFDYLLDQGLPYAGHTDNRDTLLHAAALGHSADIMARVLTLGLDVNARNKQGKTAFYIAAHRNRTQHIDLLLNAGADPTIPDIKGRTPEMVCQNPLQQRTQAKVSRAQRDWEAATRQRRPEKQPITKRQLAIRGRKR
jgi:ankyrin repeat protein